MTRTLLAALPLALLLPTAAFAKDGLKEVDEVGDKAEEPIPAEEADCGFERLADDELSLMCSDPWSGGPAPLMVVTCNDGTQHVFLGAAPGNGCSSATGINVCRTHQGCTSIL